MHDFKVKTGEALFSLLNIEQFSFESLNGGKKEKNQELFNFHPFTPAISEGVNTFHLQFIKIPFRRTLTTS